MKHLFIFKFFPLAFLLLFTACDNEDIDKSIDTSGFVKRIEDENHKTIGEFEYNKNGTLKESWNSNDFYMGDKKESYSYTYDSEGRLIKKSGFEPGNMVMSSMVGASDKDVVCSYEYDSKGRLISSLSEYVFENMKDLNFKTTLEYEYPNDSTVYLFQYYSTQSENIRTLASEFQYNNDGNIIVKLSYSEDDKGKQRIYSKEEYLFDDKHSPVFVDPSPSSKNNITQMKVISYSYSDNGIPFENYISVYNYEYEYNNKNYPTKATVNYPNKIQNIKYYIYL